MDPDVASRRDERISHGVKPIRREGALDQNGPSVTRRRKYQIYDCLSFKVIIDRKRTGGGKRNGRRNPATPYACRHARQQGTPMHLCCSRPSTKSDAGASRR
ncbi:hypothetical protein [Asticcacaulis endophyticus]|uniref:Uncharacterized protein n=1 Tax=Asticcacaulis endophyticus TaxID=1395890 RepID=A0A918Q5D8_9CAUL|nr:hypothetical protein [Asticcacaulis endophyticus]GGZ32414.1 hypothetical protein GCM10011273_18200 [Asticcacaulis endophyticus]